MSALNAATLLKAWEVGVSQASLRRALTLLAAAWPEKSVDEWAWSAIGERDGRLLQLRERLFGTQLDAVVSCPECQQRLEFEFTSDDVRSAADEKTADDVVRAPGYQIRCRVPTSADLLALPDASDADLRQLLLDRCTERVSGDNAALPEEILDKIEARMAELDPQADVRMDLTCPSCQHCWTVPFDILTYVWHEIDDWAQRVLCEVHALALAYGWTEREILGLSTRRRQLYLDMIGVEKP